MAKGKVIIVEVWVWIGVVIRVVRIIVRVVGVRVIIWLRRGLLLRGGPHSFMLAFDVRDEVPERLDCLVFFHR